MLFKEKLYECIAWKSQPENQKAMGRHARSTGGNGEVSEGLGIHACLGGWGLVRILSRLAHSDVHERTMRCELRKRSQKAHAVKKVELRPGR